MASISSTATRREAMFRVCLFAAVFLAAGQPAGAGDWPMWRHDAQRTAAADEKLSDELGLLWVREYPALEPAWPDQVAMGFLSFDVSYKPVVMGKRMFVGSSLNHRLTALDTENGEELWRFYAGGPIRFAPVACKDKVYFACDDGFLYCLAAADGKLLWRFRGGSDNRKIIGNGHLVSAWPARGAPVLADGKIYFGASIWPFIGVFLYCLDAQTGDVIWCNSGAGAEFKPAFSYQGTGLLVRPGMYGSVPQGYLTIADGRLAVPQGRNMPQIFDLKTGELVFHEIFGMHPGNSTDHWYALTAGGRVFSGRPGVQWAGSIPAIDVRNAKLADRNPCGNGVTDSKALYHISPNGATLTGLSAAPPFGAKWRLNLNPPARPTAAGSYIKAGENLYAAGAGQLLIVKDVDADNRRLVAGAKIPGGEVWDMLAADGKLFVVTIDGRIACFGAKAGGAKTHKYEKAALPVRGDGRAAEAEAVVKASGQADGYCLVLGLKDGLLAEGLVTGSKLNVIAVDTDEGLVDRLRRRLDDAGFYGARFSAHAGEPLAFGLPPYLASLIVSETPEALGLEKNPEAFKELFRVLRPYGGAICLPASAGLIEAARKAELPGAAVRVAGGYLLIERKGAPPGSAEWTHSSADAANTMAAYDKLVKPPFGVLWFGGPGNTTMLPRHGHGPSPQVACGRLFIEGRDLIRAIDIYTGRLLWERKFPGIGQFYDTGGKQAGAHETGANYASAGDGVCVITPQQCVQLDPATGEVTRQFKLPEGVEGDSAWASVRILGDLLVTTIRPIDTKRSGALNARQGAGAQWLAVFDRKTGKALWSRKAVSSWRNSAVAAAGQRIFAIDALGADELQRLKRRGAGEVVKPAIYALEAGTGRVLWKVEEGVFGTWLAYSAEHDVLVQAGSSRFGGEPAALAVHKAADGKQLWSSVAGKQNFVGPPMLHHDVIIPQFGQVVGLLDGRGRTRANPLTGEQVPWTAAAHGCGFTNAGEYVLLHRAWSHGGYTAIATAPRITGLGGFRSSCTANMIPAGGVLTVPDYTRTCMCQFKNQCSLALIHWPQAEDWTFELGPPATAGRIRRLGVNFGAPGDRLSEDGTLWLDCPNVGGPSPVVEIALSPSKPGGLRDWTGNWRGGLRSRPVFAAAVFRRHSSEIAGPAAKWVVGSGLSGVRGVKVTVVYGSEKPPAAADYTVRLYFAEPDAAAKAGGRVFSVSIQGKQVLKDFDVAKAAGGARRGVVKEFTNVSVSEAMELTFAPKAGEPIICGLEIVAQE